MEEQRHQTEEAVNDSYWINRNNELREVVFRKSNKGVKPLISDGAQL
jgi:hypothetical protein